MRDGPDRIDAGTGAQDEFGTRHHVVEQFRQDPLRHTVAVRGRGVDEGAARVDERCDLRRRLVAVRVPTPGERAQAEP